MAKAKKREREYNIAVAEETAEEKRLAGLPAKKLSISITGAAAEKLDRFCEDEDRIPSWTVDKLVLKYVDTLRHR